ncbi:hypothetical protein AX15_007466 [Amanita polypyramis BW_CC]|nr:hypothetical protein AX15_007466 [Amanita polypyramis BW_CC]
MHYVVLVVSGASRFNHRRFAAYSSIVKTSHKIIMLKVLFALAALLATNLVVCAQLVGNSDREFPRIMLHSMEPLGRGVIQVERRSLLEDLYKSVVGRLDNCQHRSSNEDRHQRENVDRMLSSSVQAPSSPDPDGDQESDEAYDDVDMDTRNVYDLDTLHERDYWDVLEGE